MSALEGVRIDGRVLAVGASDAVVRALSEAGLEVALWDRWVEPGRTATPEPEAGVYDRICMRLPKGRDTLRAMLAVAARHLAPDGRVWLYGANDEGIRSSSRQLEEYFDHSESVDARRHCRVMQAHGRKPVDLPTLDHFAVEVSDTVAGRPVRFHTLPGVFAHGRLDDGTRLLLEHLTVEPGASVLDFGCGAGAVAAFLGEREGTMTGVDIDAWAVRCASRLPGTWVVGNGFQAVQQASFDHIVSNPPFHTGKDTDFSVMDALITQAAGRLTKGGRLTFVCPSTAPVKRALDAAFSKVALLVDNRRYRVWEAR
ncbi:MAG: class I SAM-dependent methyltransferase [Myxococcota bacterium]